ncbi:MAG TPA: aminomethyltransferase family protein [Actinomycetota bacterium]|nr:aminomethyltransferase family protein [Actinomycetota bacterium]
MTVGTAFHQRTAPLNRKMQWREWAGYFAASVYADHHDIEYNAIREAAALIDVSPLYKYVITGPDTMAFVDRVNVRDAKKLQVDQVWYTCWCDEHGKVIDDGTITRLDEQTVRWTAADPSLRWFRQNAAGLRVQVEDVTESLSALAVQGPKSRAVIEAATGTSLADLRYFRLRSARIGNVPIDITRTGYTGDLGYEVWVAADQAVRVWDALIEAGQAYAIRPAGLLALDVVRVEAGLILLEVDYTSSRQALIPEQSYSPFELGILGQLVALDKESFIGKEALVAERRAGGPERRLVGLAIGWEGIERVYAAQDLPPTFSPMTSREHVPVFGRYRQIGRATSTAWSPTLKHAIALASVRNEHAEPGTRVAMEWTVEGRRGRVSATVVPLPFFDPPRKRATPPPD